METILDWFQIGDFLYIAAVVITLTLVGERLTPNADRVRPRTQWFAAIAFLSYSATAVHVWGIPDAGTAAEIVIRALLACGVAYGIGTVLFTFIGAVGDWIQPLTVKKARPKAVEYHYPPPEESKQPIAIVAAPTEAEIAANALARYERRLAFIQKADMTPEEKEFAARKAKQKYLRDLDEAMQ